MIIGIDESGNFVDGANQFHFFIAVLLDQNDNGIAIKKAQYENWLKTIPDSKKNHNGEIKGSDLSEEELNQFADQVISSKPHVKIVQVRIIPKENPKALVEKFQDIEIARLKNLVNIYREKGKTNIAKDYEKLTRWYGNRKYAQYIKLILLDNVICNALETAIGTSIALELLSTQENNFLNIKIKIDKDFINGHEPKRFWYHFIRTTFQDFTANHPIPLLDTWAQTGHKFLAKYGTNDNKIDVREILIENADFYHSHENFEIQIADIAGTIYHRYQNRNTCKAAYDKLVEKLSGKKHKIIQMELNPNPDTSTAVKFK